MKLESLPNELLLDIFDYINDVQLLLIFYNLNSRFNRLLIHSKKFDLNFQSQTKTNFDSICKQSLPKIIDRIISLHLSDDDDTPYQIEQFFSYNFNLHQFIHLQTLSLYQIRCLKTMKKILTELSQLQHLTYLKIDHINFDIDQINQFSQTIWRLSSLIYFHMSYVSVFKYSFLSRFQFVTSSSSLKYVYLMECQFVIEQLRHLLVCTPYLEELSITIDQSFKCNILYFEESLRDLLPTLTKLNIKFTGDYHELEYIFKLMPYLYELKIQIIDLNIDGYEWEQVIGDYLSKLKVFHLQMSCQLAVDDNIEESVNELLNSFQTTFWIDERQLFFRCHWDPESLDDDQYCSAFLYSLPYAFDTFDYMDPIYFKSTCPNNQTDYWNYKSVQTLRSVPSEKEEDISHFPVHFSNLHHLIIGWKLGNIRKICPILDQLTTLYIQCFDSQIQSHMQALINRAPHLQSITFYKNNWSYFFLASKSVRRLFLRDGIYYNVQQCTELCSSTLFNQCEVLQINIRTGSSVLDFLRKMSNLRVLILCYKHDERNDNQTSSFSKQDELVKWLKCYLSSECLIKREEDGTIRLWIHNE